MWEARAEYMDGTKVLRYFEDNDDPAQPWALETWLTHQHEGCVVYSVEWVDVV